MQEQQLLIEAKFFKGLADKSRLTILESVMDSEKTVSDIVKLTKLSQSNVSNHLACLLECGLVTRSRDGQRAYYQLSTGEVKNLIAVMRTIVSQHSQELFECTRY
jgi:DNA-binding transcriptional ArsR family regulator